jgi:hypothetical protein
MHYSYDPVVQRLYLPGSRTSCKQPLYLKFPVDTPDILLDSLSLHRSNRSSASVLSTGSGLKKFFFARVNCELQLASKLVNFTAVQLGAQQREVPPLANEMV